MRRALIPALAAVSILAPAAGATPNPGLPRVTGHWAMRFTAVNYSAPANRERWSVRPGCPAALGACNVRIRSTSGRRYFYELRGGYWHRRSPAPTRPRGDCDVGGGKTVHRAYLVTNFGVFRAGRERGGLATRISGTLRTSYAPVARARAQGCRKSFVRRDRLYGRKTG